MSRETRLSETSGRLKKRSFLARRWISPRRAEHEDLFARESHH